MKLLAPLEGTIDWRVEPGTRVEPGAVLAWIAGPGRCGLIPLTAREGGTLQWRRSGALESIALGEPAALLDGDAQELRQCLDAERRAVESVIASLEHEVRRLEVDERAHPLAGELLRPQRRGLEAKLALLRALLLTDSRL